MKRLQRRLVWGLLLACVTVVLVLVSNQRHDEPRLRRSVQNATNATFSPLYPPELFNDEQKRRGAILLYVFCLIYMFCALAIVCDEFFVPALEVIIERMDITEDVAGATLMAAGGSAPELFTSIIGIFVSQSDVGIGTIVGSAVFNVLFVIGMCAIFSKDVLELTWWPLFRDCLFYIISISLLMGFFYDNTITWWESLVLLLFYGCYVVFMKFNQSIEMWVKNKINRKTGPDKDDPVETPRNDTVKTQWTEIRKMKILQSAIHGKPDYNGERRQSRRLSISAMSRESRLFNAVLQVVPKDAQQIQAKISKLKGDLVSHVFKESVLIEDDDDFFDMSWPDTLKKRVAYVFLIGITGPLWLTLPDVRRQGKQKWVPVTFIGSIIWIGFFSYIMVWMAEVIGALIAIPQAIMGLTFLAAGTSVPDLITSVIVAKKGFGDMAVSSSIGSNIFDVTIGLPFPWLLNSLITGESNHVASDGLFCSISLLFIMLLLVFISIAASNWRMTKPLGVSMFLLYGVFVAVSLLLANGIIPCWL